jgi:hypothetical protein
MSRWLDQHWPFISLAFAVVLAAVYPFVLDWSLERPAWAFWVLPVLLMVHQFEEYVWPGKFRQWMNLMKLRSGKRDAPLTARFARNVNFGWTYIVLLGAAWIGESALWVPMTILAAFHVNGWFHIVESTTDLRYSPGTVTSLVGYLPLFWLTSFAYIENGMLSWWVYGLCFLGGLASHTLLFVVIKVFGRPSDPATPPISQVAQVSQRNNVPG